MKKKTAVVLTAVGEAGMFFFGAFILLTLATWFLSGVMNTLKLSGILHNLHLFIFVSGIFALTVFVFAALFKAIVTSRRFIDVFDEEK